MPSASLPMARRSAVAQLKAKSLVRTPAAVRPFQARGPRPAFAYPIEDLIDNAEFADQDDLDIRGRTAARSIMDYRSSARTSGSSSNGAAAQDAVVLSVLQNYSGLSQDRLFNMLRNSGRFNESSSTLSSILSSLVSQGKVQNEGGTYRFVSAGGRGSVSASRSPSPAPSYSRSASPVSRSAVSNGSGGGAVAGDEAVVLSVLQNYAGLTEQRLSAMIRSTGKSMKSSVSSVLNSLVSQGKVQNDKGTYRFLTKGAGAGRPSSAPSSTPGRGYSPAASRGASAASGPGGGAVAGDEAVVLGVLQNYSGLTEDRLSAMIRSSGRSLKSSVNSVLSALVSQGKVQNDRGTFRFLTRGTSPTAARPGSAPVRGSATPGRGYSPAPSRGGPGDGANAGDEAIVLAILQNYSGLAEDRLSAMVRNSRQSLKSSVSSVLNSLVSQGKVQNDKGTYRFLTKGATPTPARTSSPAPGRSYTPQRSSSGPSRGTPSAGGAIAGDDAIVLSILKNYSGLTEERLSNMIRNSGKSLRGSVRSTLDALVRSGKVSFSGGMYRM